MSAQILVTYVEDYVGVTVVEFTVVFSWPMFNIEFLQKINTRLIQFKTDTYIFVLLLTGYIEVNF